MAQAAGGWSTDIVMDGTGGVVDSTISLLRDLIAIDSVNPLLVPGGKGEGEISEAIGRVLRAAAVDVEIIEVAPGRFNVIGVVRGSASGRTLMLCGHSDTVGVEGMDAPFSPVVTGGKVYGRGSQDMKGGVASIVGAMCAIAQSGLSRGALVAAIVADEEYSSIGAEAVAAQMKADGAVVCEPTDLVIGIGHKGFSWVEVATEGRAAHGSRPDEGKDAILAMGRVLEGLARLEASFAEREHPLLGRPSLHASLISGGRELSSYPDHCSMSLERRTVEGEESGVALNEVEEILAEEKRRDGDFRATAKFLFGRPPYVVPPGSNLPDLLAAAMGGSSTRGAMTFWTDAAILGHAGIPSVVFGPGGEGLHGLVEYVRSDEVIACRDTLVRLARSFC
ncbi:MAG TPA: M20/M25/M40 family metallo-hydrolase [Thermoanaerobaculia bacterium]|nr:M20/M25/M40 family metallo-hydrolase [Thermoanaerobaculia bacterium]